jgi:hypothetical protein
MDNVKSFDERIVGLRYRLSGLATEGVRRGDYQAYATLIKEHCSQEVTNGRNRLALLWISVLLHLNHRIAIALQEDEVEAAIPWPADVNGLAIEEVGEHRPNEPLELPWRQMIEVGSVLMQVMPNSFERRSLVNDRKLSQDRSPQQRVRVIVDQSRWLDIEEGEIF